MRIATEWPTIQAKMKSATVAELTVRKAEALAKPSKDKDKDTDKDTDKDKDGPPPFDDKLPDRLLAALKALKETDQLRARQIATHIVDHICDLKLT